MIASVSCQFFSSKQPPDYVLKEAKNTNKFFKCVGSIHNLGNGGTYGGLKSAYMALTEEEFEAVSNSCFTSELNKNFNWVLKTSKTIVSVNEEDLGCFMRGFVLVL